MLERLKLWWREWGWIFYSAVFVLTIVFIAIKNDERVFMKNYKAQCDTQELFALRGKVYSCKMYKQDNSGGTVIGTILIAKPTIEANYRYLKMKEKNMEQYIASYKHLIGCEYLCNGMIGFVEDSDVGYYWVDNPPNLKNKNNKFYLDDETLGTYEEYMQLHYPEYEHVWSKQL